VLAAIARVRALLDPPDPNRASVLAPCRRCRITPDVVLAQRDLGRVLAELTRGTS